MEKIPNTLQGMEKSQGFARIASDIFAPIYPVIAEQILASTGIRSGIALDLGSGPGHLATALAAASDLIVHALDISPDMIQICEGRISGSDLCSRVIPVQGDVSSIPFEDETFDLVVSRGSWFFWDDLSLGLKEGYRVLKSGGIAYIGGGFGNAALKQQIIRAMKESDSDFETTMNGRIRSMSLERVTDALKTAGIADYLIINDESGFWVRMVHS
jgi:ubiquinone/menaquinone biosynthesis C-methylase UbiE